MRIAIAAGALCLAGSGALAAERAPEGTARAQVVGADIVDAQGSTRVTLSVDAPDGPRLVDIHVGPNHLPGGRNNID